MATSFNFSISLADFLATAISDGTNNDIYNVAKIDTDATPASQINEAGGELWSNGIDGMWLATYQQLYKGAKWWSVADATARNALGSDDALGVNDLLYKIDDSTLWYCTAVTGGSTSTWSTIASLGDVVGPGSSTDNAVTRFDGATGKLLQNSVVLIDDAGVITGVATLNGVTVEAHASRHEDGGADEIDVEAMATTELVTTKVLSPDGVGGVGFVAGGGGDVDGPGSSTDEAFARFDLATGKLIQDSVVLCTDAGVVTGVSNGQRGHHRGPRGSTRERWGR